MPPRPERKSILRWYMYRGKQRLPATTRATARGVLVWLAALSLIGLVGWLYLLQASQVAGYAHDIRTLQLDKERIHRRNVVLLGQVAEAGSLARIRRVAQEWSYSLPSAGDPARTASVVYEPLPTPTALVLAGAPGSETSSGSSVSLGPEGLIQRMAKDLDDWLASGQTESGGD
jgi:hypothetical protein